MQSSLSQRFFKIGALKNLTNFTGKHLCLESLLNKVAGLLQIFFKIGVPKNFANVTGKRLFWSLFLIKFQAWRYGSLLKRNSNTDVFLWNLRNFLEHLFYRTPPMAASGNRKTFHRLSIFYYHDLAKCSVHST